MNIRCFASIVWLVGFGLHCLGGGASAADATIAGLTIVSPANHALSVTAPFSGDDNQNNTLRVEWGLNGVDFSLGAASLQHSASPYRHAIDGLDVCKSYQVRITLFDADGAPAPVVLVGLTPNNPLLHNSISTGSSKWSPVGWGVDGGKYGEFTCGTCHTGRAPNIKRIRGGLIAPDGDQFPIEAAGGAIVLADVRDGSADFGNDTGGHAESQRICEGCHSTTAYHRYNTSGQASLTHYNRFDCAPCHRHNNGFGHGGGSGGGCIECHGHDAGYEYEPDKLSQGKGTVASHSTHTENDADDLRGPHLACDVCHDPDNFPYFKSGTDSNGDGKYSLAETDVCNTCHSPGGSFDGVNNASYGAKPSWRGGVYEAGGSLKSGKEKWCASCHDGVPAVISAQTAPDKQGDDSTYGYYVTGHGKAGTYPRMSWQDTSASGNPGANRGCLACHDGSRTHINVGASNPRLKVGYENDQNNSNCNNCHVPGGSADAEPGFYTTASDYEGAAHGGKLCTDCHDVHGAVSASPAMARKSGQALCNDCHSGAGGHPGVGTKAFSVNGKNFTLQCVSCHNVHLVTGTYAQADQNKSPVTKFSDNLNVWGDVATEKMEAYAGSGTYRTPEGESFSGAQLPDYATFCLDCHGTSGGSSVYFGINWASDNHGKASANQPNGYGTCPNWFACGKAPGWEGDDCVGDQATCWPVTPRGDGDQLYSREAYTHTDRIAGANFVLSCTDCHKGHGTGTLGRDNVNGGAFTSNWNSMCNNCHYYYSDWHAGMACGNASCHVSARMNDTGTATLHAMASQSGSGGVRSHQPGLVLRYAFENNLKDSGGWEIDGKWYSTTGSFAAGKTGQAVVLDEDMTVQVGTENANWSTDEGYHGTWKYTEMKYNTTLEAWVYPTDNVKSEYAIFDKHVGINSGGYAFSLKKIGGYLRASFNMQADNNAGAQDGRAGIRGAYSSVAIPLNQWTHVAVTFDSSGPAMDPGDPAVGRVRIFVNGLDVTTSDAAGANMQPGAGETSIYAYSENSPWNEGICYNGQWCASEFSIGGFDWESTNFIGRMDEAKVWNITKDAAYFSPLDAQTAPYISHVEGILGSNQLTIRFSEGVYTNSGASGALVPADLVLTDMGGNNSRTITAVAHVAGSQVAVVTMSAPLAVADINADTLAAVSNAIYDEFNNAAGTGTVTIGLSSQCPTAPVTIDLNEASGSPYVMDMQNVLYGAVSGGAATLTGSAFSGGGDGSGNYIMFDYNNACLRADRAMTLETRIKPAGIPNDTTTGYVRRILARDGGGNYQLSVWRNNSWNPATYSAPAGEASIALWINVASDSSWKVALTNYTGGRTGAENDCPIVSDHWYQIKAVWNTDKPGGTPGQFFQPTDIYIDDQGTDGAGSGESWVGYLNCTDTDQSLKPDSAKFFTGDQIRAMDGNFAIGVNRGNPVNNLFNGLIDWITWRDTAE